MVLDTVSLKIYLMIPFNGVSEQIRFKTLLFGKVY